jgi:hypothetical protein
VTARTPAWVGPLSRRIEREPRLQHAFTRLHALGPRAYAHFLCTLLDRLGARAADLDDHLAFWEHLPPELVCQVGGDRWPPPPLDVVPRSEEAAPAASRRRRRPVVLRQVEAVS